MAETGKSDAGGITEEIRLLVAGADLRLQGRDL